MISLNEYEQSKLREVSLQARLGSKYTYQRTRKVRLVWFAVAFLFLSFVNRYIPIQGSFVSIVITDLKTNLITVSPIFVVYLRRAKLGQPKAPYEASRRAADRRCSTSQCGTR
jgi:hypothetical protein